MARVQRLPAGISVSLLVLLTIIILTLGLSMFCFSQINETADQSSRGRQPIRISPMG